MDSQRSRALLIGASTFTALDDLPSVSAGVLALQRLLVDSSRGGLASSVCHVMVDPITPNDVDKELYRCGEEAADTLLIYYAGHGLKDPYESQLHLAVKDTDRNRLAATAVPIAWIRRTLRESDARAKVIIVDCCFSGSAIQTMSAETLAGEVDIAGSFVMTASSATTPSSSATTRALAPSEASFTTFTGTLIGILTDGVPGTGDYLDLETIYRRAKSTLRSRGLPEPEAERINEGASIALTRNPAATPAATGSLPTSPVPVTGTVKWFNDAKGFGFITQDSDGRDVFVDDMAAGFRSLAEGQKVEFDVTRGPKGLRASNVKKPLP